MCLKHGNKMERSYSSPQVVVSRKRPADSKSLSAYVGSARGLLSTVREIDEFISHERRQWES